MVVNFFKTGSPYSTISNKVIGVTSNLQLGEYLEFRVHKTFSYSETPLQKIHTPFFQVDREVTLEIYK
jgi:hypothetical protein